MGCNAIGDIGCAGLPTVGVGPMRPGARRIRHACPIASSPSMPRDRGDADLVRAAPLPKSGSARRPPRARTPSTSTWSRPDVWKEGRRRPHVQSRSSAFACRAWPRHCLAFQGAPAQQGLTGLGRGSKCSAEQRLGRFSPFTQGRNGHDFCQGQAGGKGSPH